MARTQLERVLAASECIPWPRTANTGYGRVYVDGGEVSAQKHARATHCPKGHAFTSENTYVPPTGGRVCRECKRASFRRWQAARAAA